MANEKFESKTTLLLALPAIAIIGFGAFASRIAANQKHQPPFVIVKDEFTRDNGDGYWSFDREVTVRFRRNSWWQDVFAPEKSTWYRRIGEVVTTTNTGRKVSPMMMQSVHPETYADDIRKPTQEFWEGYDEATLDKIREPLLFETTISWTEGWSSTIHTVKLRRVFTQQQRHQVTTLVWNPKTQRSEVQQGDK